MKAVIQIILINFIVYSFTYLMQCNGLYLNNLLALFPLNSEHFSPHQLVTHIFAHADFMHVVSNMLILLIVGPDVERVLGKKEFWKYFILSGIFSSGLYFLASSHPIIGASGAVFSVTSASIIINWKLQKESWSIRLRNTFFIFLIASELLDVILNTNDDVGHLAHIFGVTFGIIYFFILSKKNTQI
jgi:membrane associated rhomboid family serine protease